MKNEHAIPEQAMATLHQYVQAVQDAQTALNAYAKGLLAGMGLDSEWALDIAAGKAIKRESVNSNGVSEELIEA